MGDQENLSGKVGLDTTDFKTNVAGMNRELRVLESGFRASAAGLGDWARDASGLEMRIKSLSSQMEIQKSKVEAVRKEYERVAAEKGATSRAAQDLEIKLNKETETLGKMETELGDTKQSLEDVKNGSDDAGNGLDNMGSKAQETGGKAETLKNTLNGLWTGIKAGVAVLAATAAAVIAVSAAIGGLVFTSANAAAELVDLSAKTDISTTRLQELSYVGDQVGTSLDTITGSQARLVRSMSTASNAVDDYNHKLAEAHAAGKNMGKVQAEMDANLDPTLAAFNELGIVVRNSDGSLRDQNVVFAETIDALGKISNPAERDALAMQILGKGAMELNPLIKAGSAEIANLSAEAHKMGAVMSEDTVNGLEAFDDTLASLKAGLKGTLGTLAAAFLPGFQQIFGQLGGYLQEFSGIVSGSGGDLGKIAEGVSGLAGKIIGDLAAQMPKLLQAGFNILQSILKGATQNLPAILKAVTALLQSLIGFLVQSLPILMQAGVPLLLTLVNAIIAALPMLITAALQMIITLVQGLASAMPTLIPAVVQMLVLIVQTLIENLPLLIDAALQLILGLVQGLMAALPVLWTAAPVIMNALINALIATLPVLVAMSPQIIDSMITGIQNALPAMKAAVPEIIDAIITAIVELNPKVLEAGGSILKGLWEGFLKYREWFFDQVKGFAASIVTTIADAIGFGSPAKAFFPLGASIPQGVGVGIKGEMPQLQKQLQAAMSGLAVNADIGLNSGRMSAAGGVASKTGLASIQVGDIIIQVGQGVSPVEVGRAAEDGVLRALRAAGA